MSRRAGLRNAVSGNFSNAKFGFVASLIAGGMAMTSLAQAQEWGPEDDDGYDQYRAEPGRRAPPQSVQKSIPKSTLPKPAAPLQPQGQPVPPDARKQAPPRSADPLDPNRPQAPPQRLAQPAKPLKLANPISPPEPPPKPARPPLAQDPGILSDQVEAEPPSLADHPPDPPTGSVPPRRKARVYIPLEPVLPNGESDFASVAPPPAPEPPSLGPAPDMPIGPQVSIDPPVYGAPRVYSFAVPYTYWRAPQYVATPYGYPARGYYSADVYVYTRRGRQR